MNRRKFISASVLSAGASALPAHAAARSVNGPALLTVTGAIGRTNRSQLNPALDQMMVKQGVKFDRAYAFDFAAIAALPRTVIRPTLEYDSRPHTLSGPLLTEVIAVTGARTQGSGRILLRAVDGYAVYVSMEDVRKYRFIVATHLDGQPMPLGGLGPLWAVFEADRFPDTAAKPLAQRFSQCPWALYQIEVLV